MNYIDDNARKVQKLCNVTALPTTNTVKFLV